MRHSSHALPAPPDEPKPPTTSRKTNKGVAAMARRSRLAVRTVVGTDRGRAACASHTELFVHVEDPEFRIGHRDRQRAAAVCGSCPLRSRCGFRISARGDRPEGGR